MSRDQMVFGDFYRGQKFGPRHDFEPREWQIQCQMAYARSVAECDSGQHRFSIMAGTGSGKTKCAGLLVSHLLNTRKADQIVFVCPNRAIARAARRTMMQSFGVDLVPFKASMKAEGIGRMRQGYTLTYSHLIKDPTLHRRLCQDCNTVVVLDEVHHLGPEDHSSWGESSSEAFGNAAFVVSMTGTPYRLNNQPIMFVRYGEPDDNGRCAMLSDYSYTLGRAVAEGVCRKPVFVFHDGTVELRTHPTGGKKVVTFADDLNEPDSAARLRGAVCYGSETRVSMLRSALSEAKAEGRKVIIFVGGDTEGDDKPTTDARELLPLALEDMGVSEAEYEVIVGDDKDALAKIEHFGASPKWVLVSVNMVSEGVDIPELSCAVFLTSVTAMQTTVQRIGRVLRLISENDPHKVARIHMFAHPPLAQLASEIDAEVMHHEITLKQKREASERTGERDETRFRAEAIGVSGGDESFVVVNGTMYPMDVYRETQRKLRERGLPATLMEIAVRLAMTEGGNVDAA